MMVTVSMKLPRAKVYVYHQSIFLQKKLKDLGSRQGSMSPADLDSGAGKGNWHKRCRFAAEKCLLITKLPGASAWGEEVLQTETENQRRTVQ